MHQQVFEGAFLMHWLGFINKIYMALTICIFIAIGNCFCHIKRNDGIFE